jgi:hypothetical protein
MLYELLGIINYDSLIFQYIKRGFSAQNNNTVGQEVLMFSFQEKSLHDALYGINISNANWRNVLSSHKLSWILIDHVPLSAFLLDIFCSGV